MGKRSRTYESFNNAPYCRRLINKSAKPSCHSVTPEDLDLSELLVGIACLP